jgi:hypothetical protein
VPHTRRDAVDFCVYGTGSGSNEQIRLEEGNRGSHGPKTGRSVIEEEEEEEEEEE